MLTRMAYHTMRYMVPRRLQIAVRRHYARRRREQVESFWPIRTDAGSSPPGWPGWPQGKQFALVLTHDVDTARGLARCAELAELERQRGLRSAFYFVPEGRYTLHKDLRDDLSKKGFEIGVHGLRHEWDTFLSRRVFDHRAPHIRDYMQAWGAGGFRAPSMVHNYDWIGELGVDYDASSYDSDPFEPRSGSAGTIFPHWIHSRTAGTRYVELPYTLPQDHTLFVILQEQGPDIWKRKLDWIAHHGGMAMVIVHPDYLCMHGRPGAEEYPVKWYREFLAYAEATYGGQYWSALPREVAAYYREVAADQPARSHRRVAMAAYAFYETDNRIIRYAETLAQRGDTVEVIALRRPGEAREGFCRGVRVSRIQARERNERTPFTYLRRLLTFLFLSAWVLSRRSLVQRYDVVHMHSVPDFEVFAALLPRLLGSGVLLDVHDLSPEFYASKFDIPTNHPVVRLLRGIERLSCRFASHVIVANDLWRHRLIARSVPADRCSVVLNHVDQRFFLTDARPPPNGHFRLTYAGGLQWHQGLDLAINAFAEICEELPEAQFHIYGEGSERAHLMALVAERRIADRVHLMDPVPFAQIPRLLRDTDLGVVAKRADSFGNEAYSTKIMEYMAQGVPVICARTAIDQYYFPEDTVRFFTSGSVKELATAMRELAGNPAECLRMTTAGLAYVAENNWEIHKSDYLDIVDSLALPCEKGASAQAS